MLHLADRERPLPQPGRRAGPAPRRVLVVDDNAETRGTALRYLAGHDCLTIGARRAELAQHLRQHRLSLVVADLRAAPGDGAGLLRQIRALSDIPIILILGGHCAETDRIVHLELGADDILCDPLNLRELLARIGATLRRQEIGQRMIAPPFRGSYHFNRWVLDHRIRVLKDPAGQVVKVTKTEYALLKALLEAPRRPLSRAQLMQATRAHEDVNDRTIDAQVLRLRRKIERDPAAPRLIRTERGVGYLLDAAVEVSF